MKTLIHHLKRFSIYTLLLGAVGFAGCEDENRQDMTPEKVKLLLRLRCILRRQVESLLA
jgi:hypothetical protein